MHRTKPGPCNSASVRYLKAIVEGEVSGDGAGIMTGIPSSVFDEIARHVCGHSSPYFLSQAEFG